MDLSNYKQTPPTPIKGAVIKPSQPQTTTLSSLALLDSQRDVLIAIDAGHGGEDPGALGPRFGGKRLREKHVVLGIAKELQLLIKNEPGFEPLLTRSGDYYISLRGRTKKLVKPMQTYLFLYTQMPLKTVKLGVRLYGYCLLVVRLAKWDDY